MKFRAKLGKISPVPDKVQELVMRITKDHKGTIEADGAPGRGAEVAVKLPIPEEATQEVTAWDD